jgi:chemotaxis protein CheX
LDVRQDVCGETKANCEVVRAQLVEAFTSAACVSLAEMAGADLSVTPTMLEALSSDISVSVELKSEMEESFVLRFPHSTAAALAGRILAGAVHDINEDLIRDCMGEIANVIAGQAKAIMAGTPSQFTFALPRVAQEAIIEATPGQNRVCQTVSFHSDLGMFALQVFFRRERAPLQSP